MLRDAPPPLPPADADADAAALRRACALLESCAQARYALCSRQRHANAPHFRSHASARAQLLELPDAATLAAAAYLLRYHARVARPDALPYDDLVGAALFLACKVRRRRLAHAHAPHARSRRAAPRWRSARDA
jgi:hypothetical protein